MTGITFLHGAHDRIHAAATWLTQASSAGRRVLVYAPAWEHSEQLDRLLWTYPATSFTPHCRNDKALSAETPIVLASALDNPQHDECILNLSDQIPPGFSRFQQLIEIVSIDDDVRLPGRDRFRFYRERGYPIETFDIS